MTNILAQNHITTNAESGEINTNTSKSLIQKIQDQTHHHLYDSNKNTHKKGEEIKEYLWSKISSDSYSATALKNIDSQKLGIIFEQTPLQSLPIEEYDIGPIERITQEIPLQTLIEIKEFFIETHIPTDIIEIYGSYYNVIQRGQIENVKIFLQKVSQYHNYNTSKNAQFIKENWGLERINDILVCLSEIKQEHSIENFENYKHIYHIPFSEQVSTNTAQFHLSQWNPSIISQEELEENRKNNTEHLPYFGREVSEYFNNKNIHSFKEIIDTNKIIGSSSRNNDTHWFHDKFGFRMKDVISIYAAEMLKKSKILSSFLSDPVYVYKIFGPDGNFIYIITQNGNHRTAAAKLCKLPAFPAVVRNYKSGKIYIRNQEMLEEIEEKVKKGLLKGDLKDDDFVITESQIPLIELPNKALKKFIDEYEKLYPNAYLPYKTTLENLKNWKDT